MRELVALLKKETLEVFGNRQSLRGGMVQSLVFVVVLGILGVTPSLWLAGDPEAILLFAFLPGTSAAAIAADAFAGERERRTLDTLLASPLSERTLLAGKMLVAVGFGVTVGVVGFQVGVLRMGFQTRALFVPSVEMTLGVLGAALASSLLMAALATIVSMYVPVARAAQQIASISSMVTIGIGLAAWKGFHLPGTWGATFAAEGGVILLALGMIEIANATFRRERFFRAQ